MKEWSKAPAFFLVLTIADTAGYFFVSPEHVWPSTWVIALAAIAVGTNLLLKSVGSDASEAKKLNTQLRKEVREKLDHVFALQENIDDLHRALGFPNSYNGDHTLAHNRLTHLKVVIKRFHDLEDECNKLAEVLWKMKLVEGDLTLPEFRTFLMDQNAMKGVRASVGLLQEKAQRLDALQKELDTVLVEVAAVATQLRQANTVSQGGVGIKVGEGPTVKFPDWVGDVRRRLLTWVLRLSVAGLEEMPESLAMLGPTVARDVADTPAIRELLTGPDAPPWGHELLARLVPPAFPNVDTLPDTASPTKDGD